MSWRRLSARLIYLFETKKKMMYESKMSRSSDVTLPSLSNDPPRMKTRLQRQGNVRAQTTRRTSRKVDEDAFAMTLADLVTACDDLLKFSQILIDTLGLVSAQTATLHEELVRLNEEYTYESGLSKLRLQHRDDSIAHLHRHIFMVEEQLAHAERQIHSNVHATDVVRDEHGEGSALQNERICICCFERCSDFLTCSAADPHVFCKTCVDHRCRSLVMNPCYALRSCIECMAMSGCDSVIHGIDTTPHGRQIVGDFYLNESMPVLNRLLPRLSEAQKQRMNFLRCDGSYRGLQCAECGFGPMWNDHCTDLITHHGQSDESSGHIVNNSCVRCKTLVHDTRQMERWNGNDTLLPQSD